MASEVICCTRGEILLPCMRMCCFSRRHCLVLLSTKNEIPLSLTFYNVIKTRQDKTRQDKTRQDKIREDKTRQDMTRQDRQDKTRQDKTLVQKEYAYLPLIHSITLFSLFDHYFLCREWRVLFLLIKYRPVIMVCLWCYNFSGAAELLIMIDPHYGRVCFISVKTLGPLHF